MNTNLLEKVLWDFGNDYSRVPRFVENPDAYLSEYRLTSDEARAIRELDVRTLAENKVSVLLTMMVFMMMNGPDAMPEYMRRMNTPPGGGSNG
jgi:hypothetical protein